MRIHNSWGNSPKRLHRQEMAGWTAKAVLMASAACLVLPIPAIAQTATTLSPISVEAKAGTDVGAGGVQVDAETIDRTNPQELKDLFSGEAGATVGGAIPVSQKLYVNGLEDQKLSVQIDGARQNNTTFHHVGSIVIDPAMLKAVRIETGVAPADAGPGALAGSVEFETKDARDILAEGEALGGFTSLAFDSNTEGFTEKLTIATRHEGLELLGYVSNAHGQNFTDGSGTEVSGTAPELRTGLFKMAVSQPEGSRFEFSLNRVEDAGVRPNRPNFAGLTATDAQRYTDYRRTTFSSSYEDETPTEMIDPKLSLSYNRNEVTLTPGWYSDNKTFNGKAANTFAFGQGTVTAGADFTYDDATGGAIGQSYSEQATDIGVFGQARLTFFDDLRLSFGGRGDQQWFSGIDGSSLSNFGLSGNVNAEYDVATWLTGFAGYSNVFGAIPMGESAIYNFSGTWNYDDVKPSRARNYKAGFTGSYGPFSGGFSVFYTKINGAHNVASTSRATAVDLTSRGFNASAKYTYGDGFIRGTFNRSIVRSDGSVPSSTTIYQGLSMGDIYTLEVGHRWPDLGLKLGMTNDYAPSSDELERRGSEAQESYFVANLYAEWTPRGYDYVTLRLDAKNVLDQEYVDRANAGVDNSNVVPYQEPGQTFLLTAKVDF